MSIQFEKKPTSRVAFHDEGDWVIRCDVCQEPITGEGNVEINADGSQFWTVHKINAAGQHCGYSLVCYLREQGINTTWTEVGDAFRALASNWCESCYEREPSPIVKALAVQG